MRMWFPILLGVVFVGYFLVINLASAMTLSDIAKRPILALTRDNGAVRVPVQSPGQPAQPGKARILGGQGILFGYQLGFGMPDNQTVTCTIRFGSASCSGSWVAERFAP